VRAYWTTSLFITHAGDFKIIFTVNSRLSKRNMVG
jgi:hypothetical protein